MFLLTFTMSDVMVFSGISLGSCMWTSCSSATIQGKSWKGKYTNVLTTITRNKQAALLVLAIVHHELICRFVVFWNLTLMTWTFSMLRVAASLVCTSTVNEHPVTKKQQVTNKPVICIYYHLNFIYMHIISLTTKSLSLVPWFSSNSVLSGAPIA